MIALDIDDVIASVRAGNEDAAPVLVSIIGARLYSYVRMLDQNLSDADVELICERAVEKAIRRIEVYDPARASFHTWVRGFARQEVRDRRRMRSVQLDPNVAAEEWDLERSEPSTLAANVVAALSTLRKTDQLIIILRDVEGLPYAEICERIGGVTEVGVRKRHERALHRLRKVAVPDE